MLSVKGGVGKIIEYGGEGVKTLSVPERATITNMGAELGATTSIFPIGRGHPGLPEGRRAGEADYMPLAADADAVYDEIIDIDLAALEPLAACPHSPDNVASRAPRSRARRSTRCASAPAPTPLCLDMMKVAAILKGKTMCIPTSASPSPRAPSRC